MWRDSSYCSHDFLSFLSHEVQNVVTFPVFSLWNGRTPFHSWGREARNFTSHKKNTHFLFCVNDENRNIVSLKAVVLWFVTLIKNETRMEATALPLRGSAPHFETVVFRSFLVLLPLSKRPPCCSASLIETSGGCELLGRSVEKVSGHSAAPSAVLNVYRNSFNILNQMAESRNFIDLYRSVSFYGWYIDCNLV